MKRDLSLKEKIDLSFLLNRLYNEGIDYEYQAINNLLLIKFDYNLIFNLNDKLIGTQEDIISEINYDNNSKIEIKEIYDYLDNYLNDILSRY